MRNLAVLALVLAQALAAPARAGGPAAPAAWKNDWARGAVFYQIFLRSFADADGDGVGDLQGLIGKLDYLNDGDPATTTDLGVDAIWLTPIFQSPSYHGYDATDYYRINPPYGTEADFDRLVQEAHRRGIKVVLDLVLNHTGVDHPWFRESASSPASPRRDWYLWRRDDPGWTRPWNTAPTWHACRPQHPCDGWYYYAIFFSGMPDLNYRNPEVRAEAQRVARFWLDRGVDGFRLDAVRHLVEDGDKDGQCDRPETHAFLREFAAAVRAARPEAVLVGEAWTDTPRIAAYFGDPSKVAGGDELPMTFDFPLSYAILEATQAGDAGPIARKLAEIAAAYPAGAIDAPFLTNHDEVRVATQLGGDAGKLRAAAAVLLTLPGAPFVYYGEELGMRQPPNDDDEFKRTPMAWSAAPNGGFTTGRPWQRLVKGWETANVAVEAADPGSLLARYRALIAVRHGSAALRKGDLQLVTAQAGGIAWVRATAGERVLVAHNVSASPLVLRGLAVTGRPAALHADPGVAAAARGGTLDVTLPAYSTGVWRLAP